MADVKLRTGDHITAHCVNPGSLMGCAEPGSRVLVSVRDDPRRKFKHQLEIVYAGRTAVGIHAGRPINLLVEAVSAGKLPQIAGYATLRRVHSVPRVSTVDVVLEGNGLRPCHITVRNVTMAYEQVAYYPDAINQRDIADMVELTDLVREGQRAAVFLLVQRSDVEWFRPADHIDAESALAFRDAVARGVEVMCYRAKVTRRGIELDKKLPVDLGS